nr:hypothetical protein [uncultured Mucilaginibacter sp.]
MKKHLFTLLLFASSVFAFAQHTTAYRKNFVKKGESISALQLSNDLNMVVVHTKKNTFKLYAVDFQLRTIWKTTIKEVVVASGLFKGNILLVTSPDSEDHVYKYSYNGYLINQASGKVLLKRELYKHASKYEEIAYPFIARDGAFFKMMMRTRALEAYQSKNTKEYNQSSAFKVLSFDDKLQVTQSFKAGDDGGEYAGSDVNTKGDLILALLKNEGRLMTVYKYDADDVNNPKIIREAVDVYERYNFAPNNIAQPGIYPSALDSNIAYHGWVYKNFDKKIALNISKLNFATNTVTSVNKIIDRQYLLTVKMRNDTIYRNYDNGAKYGAPEGYGLRYLSDESGTLISSINCALVYGGIHEPLYIRETSPIITAYDSSMKEKYQKVVQVSYENTDDYAPTCYRASGKTLKVVANHGEFFFNTWYYELDTATGDWTRFSRLFRPTAKQRDFPDGNSILWYNEGFLVPYLQQKLYPYSKVSLQQISWQ